VNKIILFGFLVTAAALEATGDARVRKGIIASAWMPRCLLFVAGATVLFAYGLSINLAPVEFGRVIGLYIATLFIVWQLVNWVFFHSFPTMQCLSGRTHRGRRTHCDFLGIAFIATNVGFRPTPSRTVSPALATPYRYSSNNRQSI